MEPGMDLHAPAQPRLAMWAPWLPKVLHSNAFMYGLENERWKGTPNHFLSWENQGTLWAQMVMQKQRLWVWKAKNSKMGLHHNLCGMKTRSYITVLRFFAGSFNYLCVVASEIFYFINPVESILPTRLWLLWSTRFTCLFLSVQLRL